MRCRRGAFGGRKKSGGAGIEPGGGLLDRRGHRFDRIGNAVALALGLGFRQRPLGGDELLVEFGKLSAQRLGALFDGTQFALGARELGIGRACHRKPLGSLAPVGDDGIGGAGFARQFQPRRLLFAQCILEALDRAQLTLEE